MKPSFEVGLWPQHSNGRTQYTPFVQDANLKVIEVGKAQDILQATATAQHKVAALQRAGYAAVFFDKRVY